jgi:hypothetical protein
MPEVYSHSYLNLAAHAAGNCRNGLIFARDPQSINHCLVQDPSDGSGTRYYHCTDEGLWKRKISKKYAIPSGIGASGDSTGPTHLAFHLRPAFLGM